MRKNFRCGDHIWRALEPLWQLVVRALREGVPFGPAESAAITIIHRTVLATATRILQGPRFRGIDCDPQDVTQQFFVQILRTGVKHYQPGKPFFPYAYVTLVHLCRTQGRRAQKRMMRQIPIDLAGAAASPSRRAICKESRRRRQHAQRHLSRAERDLLADKYWRRLRSADIGVRRGLKASEIDQQTFRIRAKLRALLLPDDRPG